MQIRICTNLMVMSLLMAGLMPVAYGQTETPKSPRQQIVPPAGKPAEVVPEGTMTIERMGTIIKRLDGNVKVVRAGVWQFKIEQTWVMVVTDKKANRMRIMVPVRKAEGLSAEELIRITQANFDTALDSRYAIAQKLLWAVYIHPLSELYPRQFIKGIGQTVNLALSYGKTYNSGLLSYGGGDSRGILRRQLIDKLLKKGIPI